MIGSLIRLWENRHTYTRHARGSKVVRVRCERCRHDSHYLMVRIVGVNVSGDPSMRAREAAEKRAEYRLKNEMDVDFDCVPCPRCGSYQAEMVERLKDQHIAWTRKWIVAGCIATAFCLAFVILTSGVACLMAFSQGMDATEPVIAAVVGFAFGLIALGGSIYLQKARRSWRHGFDPNDPAGAVDRMQLGTDRGRESDPQSRRQR